jgi:hypothetical protein
MERAAALYREARHLADTEIGALAAGHHSDPQLP